MESFQRSIALDPGYAGSHYEIGRLLLQAGQVDPAVRALKQAIAIWPGNGNYHWTLMQALRRAGDSEGAEREGRLAAYYTEYKREQKRLSKRIQDRPGVVSYYEELARLHLKYQQPQRAARVLRDALVLSPGSSRLRDLLQTVEQARRIPTGAGGRQ